MNRIHLEAPCLDHEREFVAAVRASRSLHRGWVAPPDDSEKFRRYMARLDGDRNAGYLVRAECGGLAGVVNLSEIVWGAFQNAFLGFYALAPFAGRGIMRRGLVLAIGEAFRRLKLHRLEANIQPENAASKALVRRLGFEQEGYSPRYLKVGGRWRDHERWALRVECWRPRRFGRESARPYGH